MLSNLYHHSRGAAETVGQKPDSVRTIATEVCALGAVLVSVLGCVCACSAKVQQRPPELGDCYPEAGAGCSPTLSSGGAPAAPPHDAARGDASAPPKDATRGDGSGGAQDPVHGTAQDAAVGAARRESG